MHVCVLKLFDSRIISSSKLLYLETTGHTEIVIQRGHKHNWKQWLLLHDISPSLSVNLKGSAELLMNLGYVYSIFTETETAESYSVLNNLNYRLENSASLSIDFATLSLFYNDRHYS